MASEGQHSDEVTSPELKELERELRALVPRGPNIELAKLMYQAGQASLSPVPPLAPIVAAAPLWRKQWLWPASTAIAATAAAWLGVLLLLSQHRASLPQTEPRTIVQPHAPLPAPSPVQAESQAVVNSEAAAPTVPATDAHYLRARETALSAGVDALSDKDGSHATATPAPMSRAAQASAVERELGIRRSIRGGWGFFGH